MKKSENKMLMEPIRKYWLLCFIYVLFAYILIHILVLGSNMIAETTDKLFSGNEIVLYEFLFPFIVLMLLGGMAAFVKSYTRNTFSICMQTDIRNMLVSKLVRLPNSYFDTVGTGALINQLQSDMYQVETFFSELIPECFVSVITIATVCIYIGIHSLSLLSVTIICYPFLLWGANKVTKKVGQVALVRHQLYDELENVSYDVIQGILVGKTFNLYDIQKQRIFRIVDAIVENEVYRTKIQALSFVLGDLIRWLPKIVCYLFCLYEVTRGRLSIGDVLAYVMLLDKVTTPMGRFSSYIATYKENRISIMRLQSILNQEEELSGTGCFEPEENIVFQLDNISFGYSQNEQILKNISLKIKKGSKVAFVGSSGSGKSTIMKILCGFYYPQSGRYQIYGHDFWEWDVNKLRNKIALVSQNVFLFPGTIMENVAYGKPGATEEEIIDAYKKASAHDFIMQMPLGYETEVGERGIKLSGGQKQRLSIARAFLKDAPILLLDEPTSAVDMETEKDIQDALHKIAENRTVITIAHRLSTISDADEIYVFGDGKVVMQGGVYDGV